MCSAPVCRFGGGQRQSLPLRHRRLRLSDVTVEGKQAARAGDSAGCAGTITEGSPDVFINGKPAAVQGSKTGCGGAIASGATGVFVNGKPFVIAGSAADCPDK